jgi:hypothetical protein
MKVRSEDYGAQGDGIFLGLVEFWFFWFRAHPEIHPNSLCGKELGVLRR